MTHNACWNYRDVPWSAQPLHRPFLQRFSGSSEFIGAPHGLPWQNNSMDFMTLPTWPKFWKSQMFPTKLTEIGLGMIWNTSFSHPEILVLDPTKNLTCRHQDVTLRIAREHAQQLPTCPNLSSSLRPRPFFWLLFSTRHHTPRFEARILGTPCPIISDSSTSLNTTGMRYLENKIDPQNHQKKRNKQIHLPLSLSFLFWFLSQLLCTCIIDVHERVGHVDKPVAKACPVVLLIFRSSVDKLQNGLKSTSMFSQSLQKISTCSNKWRYMDSMDLVNLRIASGSSLQRGGCSSWSLLITLWLSFQWSDLLQKAAPCELLEWNKHRHRSHWCWRYDVISTWKAYRKAW